MIMFRQIFLLYICTCSLSFISAQNEVRIGVLIQDKNETAALYGATLAVKKANENGGVNGMPVRMIVKSMEGPWGTGSKQAVNLIWEHEVWALLGSHDGRNSHLVEQASAKSIVPFVSAWSSDPTLSQAFIPWFFNCVPNDDQQAETLITQIYSNKQYTSVAVISDNTYDSNQALKSFIKYCDLRQKNKPSSFNYDNYSRESDLISDVIQVKARFIILFCRPEASLSVARLIKESKLMIPVYGSLLIMNENRLSENEMTELEQLVQIPVGNWSEKKYAEFQKAFLADYGRKPGVAASFAFDGMNVLIEAIRKANSSDHEAIEKAISTLKYEGVTGKVSFGELGVRLDACKF